ncbi:MAG: MFS transporter [Thermoleophilia bacterium]
MPTHAFAHRPVEGAWYRSRRVVAWALFDFATTPFVVLITTVGFSTYFKTVVTGGSRAGDFYWGLAGALSMVVVAVIAPSAGAYADAHQAKRLLLAVFTAVAVLFTGLLATVREGMIFLGMFFYIVANIGFQGGQVFYNAFLPEISSPRTIGAISGFGFAVGYVGALVSLLAALPFFWGGYTSGNLGNVRTLFLLVAIFYALFSLPIFLYLEDDRTAPRSSAAYAARVRPHATTGNPLWTRLRGHIAELRREGPAFRFLLAYLIYMDAIMTLLAFTAIYAQDTLGLSLPQILGLFLISQLTAIPGSYLVGKLADRLGGKPAVAGCLGLWIVILVMGLAARSYAFFIAVGLLAGIGTGALQAVSRSLMAQLTPQSREAEFFGFYALAGRVSAVIGPVLFGAVSSISGNQRLAVGSLLVLVTIGLLLVRGVPVPSASPGTSPIRMGGQ